MLGREGKASKSAGKGAKGANGKDLQAELTMELRQLRRLVREVGESFILRREGEIETLIEQLETLPAGKVKGTAPEWLRALRHLNVKPAKGRLRDVKDIDHLIGALMDGLNDAQEKGKAPTHSKKKTGAGVISHPPEGVE